METNINNNPIPIMRLPEAEESLDLIVPGVQNGRTVRANIIREVSPILDTAFISQTQSSQVKPIRVGNTWTNIISSLTGENVNYEVVTTYADGSVIDDSKVDGVIYCKRGNEYLKRVYNNILRLEWFGAVCDGVTDDSMAFQKAIDVAMDTNSTIDITGISIRIEKGLVITKPLSIIGSMRQTNIIVSLSEDEVLFSISRVNGFCLDGATISDQNNNATFLKTSNSFTDASFSNLRVYQFRTGVISSYSWCNTFLNVRFQMCNKPLQLDSQTNNTEFIRCSFASFGTTMTFKNAEGINFTSCNIANYSGDRAYINLFQTQMSIMNGYFENLSTGYISVGTSNEINKSTLTILAGKCTDKTLNITLQNDGERLFLKSLNALAKYVINSNYQSSGTFRYLTDLDVDGNLNNTNNIIRDFDGIGYSPYEAYGGATLTITPYSMKSKKLHINKAFSGIRVYQQLEVGADYMLIYGIKKIGDFNLSLRHGTITSQLIINEENENIELRYIPFVATDANMYILTGKDDAMFEIERLVLVKGHKLPLLNKSQYLSNVAPTEGYWRAGTVIQNSILQSSIVGWRCTVSGTPGAWLEF